MALNTYKDAQTCAAYMQPRSDESTSPVPANADARSGTGGLSAFAVRITTGGAPYGGTVDLWFLHNGGIETVPKQKNRVAAALDSIQRAFGLSTSDLARVCDVDRRMIYQWRAGSKPRESNLERIFLLERAAKSWVEDGFPVPGIRFREPLVDGRSIFDLLSDDSLDLDAIHFAGSRLHLDSQLSASGQLKDPFG